MSVQQSLILVTVDCLRADHTGFLGYERPTTPFLDSLARESLIFRNAVAAGAPTYHAFPAIMASRYPMSLGRDQVGVVPGEPTLASTLRDAGYNTAAFIAGNPYLSRRFGYDFGFDLFEDFLSAETTPVSKNSANSTSASRGHRVKTGLSELCHALGPVGLIYDELYFQYAMKRARTVVKSFDQLRRYPAANVIVDRAKEWLNYGVYEPFFLWLHFMDPHGPYYPPEEALKLMGDDKLTAIRAHYVNVLWSRTRLTATRLKRHREETVALYDAGIRWVDTQIARLVDTLRHLGLWERCIFAFTADHGEEFLDHGDRFHFPPKVTEELIHVPLLLHAPHLQKTPAAGVPFSLIHLVPTLLEGLGVSLPGSSSGRSHWGTLHNEDGWAIETVTECCSNNPCETRDSLGTRILAVRQGRYKLTFDFASRREQLFDLEADPAELHPLPPHTKREVRQRLLDRTRQHVTDCQQSHDSGLRLQACLRELRHDLNRRGAAND